MKSVYLDNAATTPIREDVILAVSEVMKLHYGNPSSSHSTGRASKVLVEQSRHTVAKYLNVLASEIVFTSGGTEANNLILQSAVRDLGVTHIITSNIEHHAVLDTVKRLKAENQIAVSYVNLDATGQMDYLHLEVLLKTEKKTLVSLMHINNEIGNILNLKRVSKLCKANKAFFHTDAVQSIGHYTLDLRDLDIDFLTASAHKFHGPKGIGFAYIKKNKGIKALFSGGEQERGLRPGTESVPNIVGLEKALQLSVSNLVDEKKYVSSLKAYFISKIKSVLPNVKFNGNSGYLDRSSYTLINVCLPFSSESSMLLFQLDLKGIACSRGSACQSGSPKKSHVLTEILSETDLQKPSIRFSFSIFNTREDIDYVIEVLKTLEN